MYVMRMQSKDCCVSHVPMDELLMSPKSRLMKLDETIRHDSNKDNIQHNKSKDFHLLTLI